MADAEPIVIVDYDPQWPGFFEAEKERLLEALRPYVLAIEHIGSTAVPGLAAKNTVDILPGLYLLQDAPPCIARLEKLGYTYRPDLEAELPERRYFSKGSGQGPGFHLHMVEVGGDFWRRDIEFRDWMRQHPDDAKAYAGLKRELAHKFGGDRDGYTRAKTAFIEGIKAKARAEAGKGPPPVS